MWPNRSKNFYFYIIIAAVIILVAAILAYFTFSFYKGKLVSKTPSPAETSSKGFLLLTLKPRTENATSGVFVYNLDEKILRFFNDRKAMNMSGHGLPSGLGVTSSRPLNLIGTADENIWQLYQVDMKNNFQKKQITSSRTFLKRHPEWSPDGQQIAFMAKQELDTNATSTVPDDWSIYVTDLNGNEKLLGPGAYPQWSPDNKKLVFLRSDGLYLYDLAKQSSVKVRDMGVGRVFLRSHLDVSRDGSRLALSVPDDHQLILAEISSWEPFSIRNHKIINNIFVFWPVFSPDAKYLAMITGDEKGIGVANPYVAIYNIETLEPQKALDLNNFSINSMALTDWGILK